MSRPRRMTELRCITFDLDDTLWDCEPVILRAEERFHEWLGENFPRICERYRPDAMSKHRRRFFTRFPEKGHDITWLRKRWLAHIAEQAGYGHEEVVEPAFQVFWKARNEVELYEYTHELLGCLRKRYRVGCITNGNADVHHIGIGHYFDFVVTAAAAGASKPDPRIFETALRTGGVSAEETLHVGDDALRDVLGAGALGIRTVWFNPALTPWPGGRQPDHVVRNLRELRTLLERL